MPINMREENPHSFMQELETLYNKERDTILIEIKLKHLRQLFNTYDPSPFFEKDLDDDAVHYIVSTVKEFPLKQKQKLVLYFPHFLKKKINPLHIQNAISHFFKYQNFLARRNLRAKLREARTEFFIAFVFLFIALAASESIVYYFEGLISRLLAEGIIITAWVGMWRPLDAILFEWLPIRKDALIYDKIAHMDVDVRFH